MASDLFIFWRCEVMMLLAKRPDHYVDKPIRLEEAAERAMHDWKTYPPMHPWHDHMKYILTTLLGRAFHLRPSPEQMADIIRTMKAYATEHCKSPEETVAHYKGIEEMRPRLQELMTENYGFYKFMRDHGAKSLSYARFPVSLVPRAIALESAFGVNYDNAGVYHELAPGCISMRCGVMEYINVDLRRRAGIANQIIQWIFPELVEYRTVPAKEKLGCVITLGAGLLVEFRKFGLTLEQLQSLQIIACDMDETLLKELDVVFKHDFGVPFVESGIDYRLCSIDEVLADKNLQGAADVVLMDGVLSYCDDEAHMERYVRGMKDLLKPNGVICCDLQVLVLGLIMCAVVHGWKSSMKPEKSADAAIAKMERVCARVGGLNMTYEVDPRNPEPVGVTFKLKRS